MSHSVIVYGTGDVKLRSAKKVQLTCFIILKTGLPMARLAHIHFSTISIAVVSAASTMLVHLDLFAFALGTLSI